jgi:predicted metal-dependent hydrolase
MMTVAPKYKIERREVKHARIKVSEDLSVRVIAPNSFSEKEIELILKQKAKWIESKLAYFSSHKKQIRLQRDQIFYLGDKYRYFYYSELKNAVIINNKSKTIRSGKDLLDKEIQKKWLKKEARRLILERLEYYSTKHRFNYNRVFIRSQKSKWGNCSQKKNLSFNWRLIQTPLYVIDYLVVHELVHTQVMDHSNKFWFKVKLAYPGLSKAIKWLNRHSSEIQF